MGSEKVNLPAKGQSFLEKNQMIILIAAVVVLAVLIFSKKTSVGEGRPE